MFSMHLFVYFILIMYKLVQILESYYTYFAYTQNFIIIKNEEIIDLMIDFGKYKMLEYGTNDCVFLE